MNVAYQICSFGFLFAIVSDVVCSHAAQWLYWFYV